MVEKITSQLIQRLRAIITAYEAEDEAYLANMIQLAKDLLGDYEEDEDEDDGL